MRSDDAIRTKSSRNVPIVASDAAPPCIPNQRARREPAAEFDIVGINTIVFLDWFERPWPRCQRIGQHAGVRRDHKLDRHAKALRQLVAEIGRDATLAPASILDDEKGGHFRRERDAEAKLAVGMSSFTAAS